MTTPQSISHKVASVFVAMLSSGCIGPSYYPRQECIPLNQICEPTIRYKGTFEAGESTIDFEVPSKYCRNEFYEFSINTPAGVALIWGNNDSANVEISHQDGSKVDLRTGRFYNNNNDNDGIQIQSNEKFNCFNRGKGIECNTVSGNPKNANKVAWLVYKILGEYLPAIHSRQ
ncbi:hypothetical protein HQ489_01895 [Candidatus Woesearchaeota archaeon]|nr:hypothetical protein [Candidatus Woesearchaeota archaeon]